MDFKEIRGWNVNMGKDQPEFTTVRIRKGVTHIDNGKGILVPYHSLTAEMAPTPEELAHMNGGGSMFLNFLCLEWPPVSLEMYDPLVLEPSHGSS